MCFPGAVPPHLTADAAAIANATSALASALTVALGLAPGDGVEVDSIFCVQRESAAPGVADISMAYTLAAAGAPAAQLQFNLDTRFASAAGAAGITASVAVSSSKRLSVCGNELCEIDETHASCLSDCLMVTSCPTASPLGAPSWTSPLPCSGHGACRSRDGTCICSSGYTGSACGDCARGYAVLHAVASSSGAACESILDNLIDGGGVFPLPGGISVGSFGFTALIALATALCVAGSECSIMLEEPTLARSPHCFPTPLSVRILASPQAPPGLCVRLQLRNCWRRSCCAWG